MQNVQVVDAEALRREEILDEMERTKWKRIGYELKKDWRLYLLLVPLLVFMLLFKYLPIYGTLQGFKYYTSSSSVMDNYWTGFQYVTELFMGQGASDFWRAFRNTFVTSMYGLVFGFPIPIILALLFSEIKVNWVRSIYQVCTYLPKFLSTVVVTTIVTLWCYQGSQGNAQPGVLASLFAKWGWVQSVEVVEGGTTILYPDGSVLQYAKFFRPIYQITNIWQDAGYGSIVYFAAIMAISPTNYEAAKIDGASKLQEIRYVTFPGMAPTLSIMLIMRIGQILNIGYEKIMLLYDSSNSTYIETADVVSTLIYRWRITPGNGPLYTSMGVIADLFNSLIAMVLVLGSNAISRRVSDTALF